MLDQSQIQAILDDIIPIFERLSRKKMGLDGPFASMEDREFTNTYRLYVGMLDDISVHSVRGVFPANLIVKRSPYQTDEEFNHTKENYKQITTPVFDKYVNTIQRSFADSGWSIEYPEYGDEDNLRVYLDETIATTPLGMSLESWVKNVLPPIKLRDAGGCIAVRPWFIPLTEQDGETVIGSERYQPIPYYFDSRRLVAYNEMEYFMFLSAEKSIVTYSDKKVKDGLVFELYDKRAVWRIVQVGKKVDYTFTIEEYYVHDRGEIPVTRLKGNPFYQDQELVYGSPFLPAVDILNEAILDNNNLRAIKDKCVYPVRVMIGDSCNYSTTSEDGSFYSCEGGYIVDPTRGRYQCPSCHGSGRKNRLGASGEILIDSEAFTKESELPNAGKAMYYVEPSTATPGFLREEVDGYFARAESILHIKTTNTEKVQPAQGTTATESQIDQKAMHAAVRTPRTQIFDIYEWTIDWIAYIAYGEGYEVPTINVSDSFDLKTEADCLNEISQAVEAGVPQFVIHQLIRKYLSSLYYSQSQASQATDLLIAADRLLTVPSEEIQLRLSSGLVSRWEVILHDSGISLVQELLQSDPKLFEKDITEQVKAVTDLAKTKATDIEATRSTGQPSTLEQLRSRIAPTEPPPTV